MPKHESRQIKPEPKPPRKASPHGASVITQPADAVVPWLTLLHLLLRSNDEKKAIATFRLFRKGVRSTPALATFLGLPPLPSSRPRGRPIGSRSIDVTEALAIVLAIDHAGFRKARVLRLLKKETNGPAPYRWLQRRLGLGRTLYTGLVNSERASEFLEWFDATGKQHLADYLSQLA